MMPCFTSSLKKASVPSAQLKTIIKKMKGEGANPLPGWTKKA